jgi:hypothetical protein
MANRLVGKVWTIRTPAKRAALLAAMAKGLTTLEAAKAAGVSRQSLHEWRQADPEFDAAFQAAYDAGTDIWIKENVARSLAVTCCSSSCSKRARRRSSIEKRWKV